ncbi:hypothetical protein [Dactylosporangium sp. NPDC051541]|uniref:hypothetical protein n=1 Tax=Dactylosporangium sp. NPDC051541 TaxID=3363977 RepID=UPI003792511E
MRLLAQASIRQWSRSSGLVDAADPIKPWSVSLVAREALAGGLAAQGRQNPDAQVLPALDVYVHELEDPLLRRADNGAAGDGSVAGFMLRTGYQQFPYQQPIFGDTARMRPMLKRSFPRPRFQVLSDAVIEELLGADVDAYTDLAPFFLAAVMVNGGTFNPTWLDQPNFVPVCEQTPKEQILRVYSTRLSAPAAKLQAAARAPRHQQQDLRQHDFNPLIDRPFVVLPDGIGLAPQPLFVTGRFSLAALYYAGFAAYGKPFADDLGILNEEYTLEQLAQLNAAGAVVTAEVEYEPGSASVDGFVVYPDQVILVEVKSLRPALDKRLDSDLYAERLRRDLGKAQKQLRRTYDLWRNGHPAFAHLPDDGRPARALIVVPEPLYLANQTMFGQDLGRMPFPTAVVSFTQLELLVAVAVSERSGRVFADIATGSPYLIADPAAALMAARQRSGIRVHRNGILDASFEAMRWAQATTP